MRNFPLQFVREETIEHIAQVGSVRREEMKAGGWAAKLWRAIMENLDGDGPRSIANLERAMRVYRDRR